MDGKKDLVELHSDPSVGETPQETQGRSRLERKVSRIRQCCSKIDLPRHQAEAIDLSKLPCTLASLQMRGRYKYTRLNVRLPAECLLEQCADGKY